MFNIKENKCVVIILNYNTAEEAIRLANKLLSDENVEIKKKIIIIDNSTNENEFEFLQKEFITNESVEIIKTINKGYSNGNNIGLKYARENGYNFFLILNPDIELVTERFIDNIYLSFLANDVEDNLLLIGPEVCNPYYCIHQSPILRLGKFGRGSKKLNAKGKFNGKNVYSIVGCCMFGHTERFNNIENFDEDFFLYYEEHVIGEKAIVSDYRIVFDRQIKVRHLHELKFNSFKKEFDLKKRQAKSLLLFLSKYKKINIFEKILIRLTVYIKIPFIILIKFVFLCYKTKNSK